MVARDRADTAVRRSRPPGVGEPTWPVKALFGLGGEADPVGVGTAGRRADPDQAQIVLDRGLDADLTDPAVGQRLDLHPGDHRFRCPDPTDLPDRRQDVMPAELLQTPAEIRVLHRRSGAGDLGRRDLPAQIGGREQLQLGGRQVGPLLHGLPSPRLAVRRRQSLPVGGRRGSLDPGIAAEAERLPGPGVRIFQHSLLHAHLRRGMGGLTAGRQADRVAQILVPTDRVAGEHPECSPGVFQ